MGATPRNSYRFVFDVTRWRGLLEVVCDGSTPIYAGQQVQVSPHPPCQQRPMSPSDRPEGPTPACATPKPSIDSPDDSESVVEATTARPENEIWPFQTNRWFRGASSEGLIGTPWRHVHR